MEEKEIQEQNVQEKETTKEPKGIKRIKPR